LRALNIAIFIFLLSLSMSAVKAAYGLSYSSPMLNTGSNDISEAGRVEGYPGLEGYNMFKLLVNSIQELVNIIAGAALLGNTLQGFIPYPLPGGLVAGLDALSSASAVLAVIQFARGVGMRVMD
jgi:hypothetical protein